MSNISVWIKAARLRTLPLALSSILMGSFLAYFSGVFRFDVFILCITTTVSLQVLSNLANDLGDSIHGADSLERKGPARAVQSGAITALQMRGAVLLLIVLSLVSGVFLIIIAFGNDWKAISSFFAIGVACILAAIAYTVGKRPYGYAGLGDLSVMIFFGLVGVMGSFYLFTKQLSWTEILPAFSCGFFSMAVLNINNIRDIESDKKAGKLSIPVRIGRKKAILYHWALIFLGIVGSLLYTAIKFQSPWQLIFLVSVPLFLWNGIAVSSRDAKDLDPFLKQMAMSTLLFVLTFGIGLVLA
jgi:1,4-dihydroxy-2-naphthoate polyprenyltransferase